MDKDITRAVLARTAQDRIIPQEEWAERARRALANAEAYSAMEEAEKGRMMRPTAIYPGNTFNTVPVKQRPNNWLYNTLSNPKLNTGLETLAGNAADVLLGRESGNNVVDLGVSNIPGIGAASIIAAGGMPGIVDAVGAGELRNIKRIPKYTYEFVKEFFGDKGLRNLDNALTKYPKAEKPTVNDALYLMRTGMGGEKVNAIKPYSSNTTADQLAILLQSNSDGDGVMKQSRGILDIVRKLGNEKTIPLAERAYNKLMRDIERGDLTSSYNSYTALATLMHDPLGNSPITAVVAEKAYKNPYRLSDLISNTPQDVKPLLRRFAELDESTVQDWETIARKQELKNARDLEKQAKKQAKELKKEQPKAEQPKPVEVAPEAQETPKGGPNMWRENGWDPNVIGDNFYSQFGGNLTPESKRDMFVLDSLANHWAKQIVGEGKAGKMTDADIVDALDRAEARHTRSNYNAVSQGFYDDLKKNIETGNMPGKAVTFGPKYRKNVITNRDTPTLVLDPSERPRFYNDVRIWADEQEGPDLYEMVFRPKSDEILNSINPAYWLYRK